MKNLINITPSKYKCAFDASCPAVFKVGADGTYYIVGKTLVPSKSQLKGKVGADETAVEISADLLETAIANAMLKKTFTNP
jgi:hypothetical protein